MGAGPLLPPRDPSSLRLAYPQGQPGSERAAGCKSFRGRERRRQSLSDHGVLFVREKVN